MERTPLKSWSTYSSGAGGGGAMGEEVILLDFWASPYAMRVKVGLAEKGVEYEAREEDLFGGKSSLLLEMNPLHKLVPVLIHNGRPVCESFNILEYVDQVWTHQPSLFPSDPYELAQVRFWADISTKVNLGGRGVWIGKEEDHEATRKELIRGLRLLESELGDKPYFGGERFGALDVVVIPTSSWFQAIEVHGRLSLVEECPKLVEWAKRCSSRDSVSKSLPDQLKVYEFSLVIKKALEAQQQQPKS